MNAPVVESDSFTVLSKLAEASHWPSGLNASALTGWRCAVMVRSGLSVSGSQIFRPSRKMTLARRPSRLKATGIIWDSRPGQE